MFDPGLSKLPFGGDYNPEQWDPSVWVEDMRLFKLAGIDFLRINIFAWVKNQPEEARYDLHWIDEIFDFLHGHGMKICLGTGTAAHPAWMAKKYPDILRVDTHGRRRAFGDRHNSCPNSPNYRRLAAAMAGTLAARYKNHPALALWNISNEFGGVCYCENCASAFRTWLRRRYGSLKVLNTAWNTSFWGHTFGDWEEIVPPNNLSEQWSERGTCFQPISLDYNRFNSDSLLECYRIEYDAIRSFMPDAVITTNIMGFFRQLDYAAWAPHLDIVAWDNYPTMDAEPYQIAMAHDMMRGLRGGEPFLLMEQTPSQANWHAYNSLKRPGVMRLLSYQAVARGADSVLFFQMRRSVGACEKFHGAVIEHAGHENTRVFREVAALGGELKKLGTSTLGSRIRSRVGLYFDWENWWAVEFSSGPSIALQYLDEIKKWYKALYDMHIQVDMIGPSTGLQDYDLVCAPVLYMPRKGYAQKLAAYVEQGGIFVTGFLSGIVDENDKIIPGGYPGDLRELLGIWIEEVDALPPERFNRIVPEPGWRRKAKDYRCTTVFDLLHTEGAEVYATYSDDFYAGRPVVTKNVRGKGAAWYIASSPDAAFLRDFISQVCEDLGIDPVLAGLPPGIEATFRVKDGHEVLFLLNHNNKAVSIDLKGLTFRNLLTDETRHDGVELSAYGVLVAERVR